MPTLSLPLPTSKSLEFIAMQSLLGNLCYRNLCGPTSGLPLPTSLFFWKNWLSKLILYKTSKNPFFATLCLGKKTYCTCTRWIDSLSETCDSGWPFFGFAHVILKDPDYIWTLFVRAFHFTCYTFFKTQNRIIVILNRNIDFRISFFGKITSISSISSKSKISDFAK